MDQIIISCISGAITLIGVLVTNLTTHSKTMYRIEQLEKKQDKHNEVIERMYLAEKSIELLEQKIKTGDHRIKDLEEITGEWVRTH